MAILTGRSRGTDRSRRTDVARSTVAAGRTHRARVTGRADRSGGTLVNWDFQNIVKTKTNILVSRGARRGPDGCRRCASGGSRFRHHNSWAFLYMF